MCAAAIDADMTHGIPATDGSQTSLVSSAAGSSA
jgi:hypothetical protein